jgi:hypothetical protein
MWENGAEVLSNIDHLSPLGTLVTWVLGLPLHLHPNLAYKVFPHDIKGYSAYFMEDFETFFSFFFFFKEDGWMG